MKKSVSIVLLVLAIALSVGIVYYSSDNNSKDVWAIENGQVQEISSISQKTLEVSDQPTEVNKLYYKNSFIGVITDMSQIDKLLSKVEEEKYREEFPDTKVSLGEDVYIVSESSYFVYEDIDDKIINFLLTNDLFSIEVDKIVFSNGQVLYVKDIKDFEEARRQYLLNFISENELNYLINSQLPPEIKGYGDRSISIKVVETAKYTRGFSSINNIYTSKNEIVSFLSYGHNVTRKNYTVQKYDTVEGVGSKTGLTAQQIVTINPELVSVNQLLSVGMQLNVQYFTSPINVVVEKEMIRQEPIYPAEPVYEYDNTMAQGKRVTVKEAEWGSEKVTYKETYINGVLQEGAEELSREVIKQSSSAHIRVGTKVIPHIGSGNFRYPIDNVTITCGWYCYANHTAIDLQNKYNRYGNVYAADRGTVVVAGYNGVNGYYVWINHNNGFRTYYGHLNRPAYVTVGQVVVQGEVIGQIGKTGVATGPHVHFVIEYQGSRHNPCRFLGC